MRERASGRRRVLFVDLHFAYLGAQRVLVDFLAAGPSSIEPVVLCAGEPRLMGELDALGVPAVTVPMPEAMAAATRRRLPGPAAVRDSLGVASRVRREIARVAPDAMVVNTPKAHVMAALAAPRSIPLGARLHDILPTSPHIRALARGLLAPRTASTSCVSDAVRRSAVGLGFAPDRAVTFFNAGPAPVDLGPPEAGGPTLAVVGQIEPWKGQDVAVDAFAEIARRHPEARLRVIGRPVRGPAYARYLRARVDELGLGGRVHFEEGLSDLRDIWSGVDVLMHLPRRPDPLPTVILEALAFGIPVVASRTGGIPEMVEEGVTGLLVPVADPPAVAEAASRLLADPALAAELARHGRAAAAERFARSRYVAEYEAWAVGLADRTPRVAAPIAA